MANVDLHVNKQSASAHNRKNFIPLMGRRSLSPKGMLRLKPHSLRPFGKPVASSSHVSPVNNYAENSAGVKMSSAEEECTIEDFGSKSEGEEFHSLTSEKVIYSSCSSLLNHTDNDNKTSMPSIAMELPTAVLEI